MTDKGSSYFAKYYAENKEKILSRRRQRYKEDPEYREKIMARAREAKRKLLAKRKVERAKNKDKNQPTRFRIQYGDEEIPVDMYTTGQVAKKLGRTTQTIRIWEKNGLIPEALYRTTAHDRLYTELQLTLLVEAYRKVVKRFGARKVLTRIGSTNFSDLAHKIWEDHPLGIEEE